MKASMIQFLPHGKEINDIIDAYFPENIYVDTNYFSGRDGCVGCSDPYWRRFLVDRKFYFSFPEQPTWIEEVVNLMNSLYKNIQIEIYRNQTIRQDFYIKFEKHFRDVNIPVYSINYSSEYPSNFRKYSGLIIHHLFRMFNTGEHPIDIQKTKLRCSDAPKDIPQFIEELNNDGLDRYRMLSEVDFKFGEVLNLDDINLINFLFENYPKWQGVIKQTEILLSLKLIKEFGKIIPIFNIGDIVNITKQGIFFYGESMRHLDFKVAENDYTDLFKIALLDGDGNLRGQYKSYFFKLKENKENKESEENKG